MERNLIGEQKMNKSWWIEATVAAIILVMMIVGGIIVLFCENVIERVAGWIFRSKKKEKKSSLDNLGKTIKLRNQNHPERLEGEVFLGNVSGEDFWEYQLETKRMGVQAFDIHGNCLSPDHYPVFAKRKELEEKGYILVEE